MYAWEKDWYALMISRWSFRMVQGLAMSIYAPSVVPALCIVYSTLLFLSRRCTAATSLETEAEGVPIGMRQKSVFELD